MNFILSINIVSQSYSMRNGVLSVIGELIIKILSRDDLDPNLKNTRDKFLDRLEVWANAAITLVRTSTQCLYEILLLQCFLLSTLKSINLKIRREC